MENYRKLFNVSYQRTISRDYEGFFGRFYQIFTHADPLIYELFKKTDMEQQYLMLAQSMTHIISF